jgi:prophage regulatory protein
MDITSAQRAAGQKVDAEPPRRVRDGRLLRIGDVVERTSLSETTIRLMRRQGNFPAAIALSRRRVAWRESDIEEFVNSRQSVALKPLPEPKEWGSAGG